MLFCYTGNKKDFSLGDLPERNIDDINSLYNFKITETKNNEICNISENEGTILYSVNPTELDYNSQDTIKIQYQTEHPERLKGIKLNNDSLSALECTNKNKIKECTVPSNHFTKSGLYYTYYNNSFGLETISYEVPTIKIVLKEQKTEKETDSSNPESDSSLVGIIVGSVVGGLVLIAIGIILFIIIRKRKRGISTNSEFVSDLEKEQEQNLVPDSLHVEMTDEKKVQI